MRGHGCVGEIFGGEEDVRRKFKKLRFDRSIILYLSTTRSNLEILILPRK